MGAAYLPNVNKCSLTAVSPENSISESLSNVNSEENDLYILNGNENNDQQTIEENQNTESKFDYAKEDILPTAGLVPRQNDTLIENSSSGIDFHNRFDI